jgi:hypothetical protein
MKMFESYPLPNIKLFYIVTLYPKTLEMSVTQGCLIDNEGITIQKDNVASTHKPSNATKIMVKDVLRNSHAVASSKPLD